jgi:serine/threonine-protein kinase
MTMPGVPPADASSPGMPPQRTPLALKLLAASVAVLTLGVTVWLASRPLSRDQAPPGKPAAATVVPAAVPLAAVPTATVAPACKVPAACEVLAEGVRWKARANAPAALQALRRAVKLDPGLAAAHLRVAGILASGGFVQEARHSLAKASELRDQLPRTDQLALHALEPVVLKHPADKTEHLQRARDAVKQQPDDRELIDLLVGACLLAEDLDCALDAANQSLRVDRDHVRAIARMATVHLTRGDTEAARADLERCLALEPTATYCLSLRWQLAEASGACKDAEAVARSYIAAQPENPTGYQFLARSLAAQERPEEAVREVVEQYLKRVPEARRADKRRWLDYQMAAWQGRFDEAAKLAREAAEDAKDSTQLSVRSAPARALAEVLVEGGRIADAVAVAEDFLRRRDGWEPFAQADDYAVTGDASPDLVAVLVRAGKLDAAKAAAIRDAWAKSWHDLGAGRVTQGHIWVHAWADLAWNEQLAQQALAELPARGPVPPLRPADLSEIAVGRAHLLAGKPEEAARWLEAGAQSCRVLEFPVRHTEQWLWLGRARQALGDTAGACAAYGRVLARWGAAVPKSVSAADAKARSQALRCPR